MKPIQPKMSPQSTSRSELKPRPYHLKYDSGLSGLYSGLNHLRPLGNGIVVRSGGLPPLGGNPPVPLPSGAPPYQLKKYTPYHRTTVPLSHAHPQTSQTPRLTRPRDPGHPRSGPSPVPGVQNQPGHCRPGERMDRRGKNGPA